MTTERALKLSEIGFIFDASKRRKTKTADAIEEDEQSNFGPTTFPLQAPHHRYM